MSFFPQGTFFGLGLMGKSLDAFQYAANVTSDNIANVNTPGASRQNAVLTEAPAIVGSPAYATHVPGTAGDGVIVQQIARIHSDAYDALFRGASSSQNFFQLQQQQLQALQGTLGDPNAGIGAQFTAFQQSIDQLVAQASGGQSASARQNVLVQAQSLARSLNDAAGAIAAQKAQVLQQGATIVTKVNGILDRIAALNGQIRASSAVGDNPNTFADQRDYLIDQLSQYLSTQTSIQADGSTLVTVNGRALVNDTVAYHLAPPAVGIAQDGTPAFKVDFATNPPAMPNAPGIPLGSGQLAAMQDLYNNKLTAYGAQFDRFAASLANEVNRITQSSYDRNGQPGAALFQPIVATQRISAGNIRAAIVDPAQLPVALANTQAGNLVVAMNSSNNSVDTSAPLLNNGSLANPPIATLSGSLTVTVNGVAQTFNYTTASGGNADTIDHFVSSFNAAHLGVSASFDAPSQRIVFARDPANEDLVLRGSQQNAPSTPGFMIADSNFAAANAAASLLGVLGANGINNVAQNASNAFAANDNGGANALVQLFASYIGVPPLEAVSATAATAGIATTVALPPGITNVAAGTMLALDARPGGAAPQENVLVTATSVDPTTGIESITFTPAANHAANFTIATAPQQTLGQFYGSAIAQVGLDAQTAITGTVSQTTLAKNIDQVRQSISGINLDEETQNLIKYQNAYQAAAKTISVLDQLVQTVINNLGVGR